MKGQSRSITGIMEYGRKPWQTALLCLLLTTATLITFQPVVQNGFINYDDPDYVTENPQVLTGLAWDNIQWAFTTNHAGNWHPLTWLSHQLDCQLFGLKPAGHHITSLFFHIANTLLVFLLLKRLTGTLWQPVLVAALFAVHPLRVESVAWVAERKDVLSCFFLLLTLLAYANYVSRVKGEVSGSTRQPPRQKDADLTSRSRQRAAVWYCLALLLFALGLMCKPMLVTLPMILLLLDYWPLQRFRIGNLKNQGSILQRLTWEKFPFFGLSLASCIVTFLVQRGGGAVSSLENLPLEFRLSNALISYVRYAAKTIWPSDLAVIYPIPSDWPLGQILGAALLVTGMSGFVLWRMKQLPHVAIGWLWFVGTLVPVIGIVQVGLQAMADRYSYIPQIGLLVAIVWSIAEIPTRWPAAKAGIVSCAILAVAGYALMTWTYLACWRNSQSLFEHVISATQDNAIAHNNLGASLLTDGIEVDAETHFAEAVRLKPNYADALVNLGLSFSRRGDLQTAISLLQKSLQFKPTVKAHYNLATLLMKQGAFSEAESHFETALQLKPDFAEARYNLGVLMAKQNRGEEAMRHYAATLQIKPDYAEAHLSLGAMLASQQKHDEAIAHFRAALRTASDNADAHFNLAASLNIQGDFAGAASHYAEACRQHPEDVEAREGLGIALACSGRVSEAVTQFNEVLRLRPDAKAHGQLALALVAQGRAEDAISHYREAIRLSPNSPVYLNELAWILATHPKPEARDGLEAVRLAELACRLSGGQEPRFWGTLDAAYAEVGRFDEAIATAKKARELALAINLKEIAQAADERMKLYQSRIPYRQPQLSAIQP